MLVGSFFVWWTVFGVDGPFCLMVCCYIVVSCFPLALSTHLTFTKAPASAVQFRESCSRGSLGLLGPRADEMRAMATWSSLGFKQISSVFQHLYISFLGWFFHGFAPPLLAAC